MEIQFEKTILPYMKTVLQQFQSQELTQQVRLSDAMPDVGRVIASWGQILLRGKEWHSDCFHISGGVKVWILYEPENETKPHCVDCWLPFQMKWDIPDVDTDGTVMACPMTPSVDARMLSDRKLMVRANVSIEAVANVQSEAELYRPTEFPTDLQMLQCTYPMLLPVENGEKVFEIEENISLPAAEQPIASLLRYTLQPVLSEWKVVADKLVLRGLACLRLLYMGTDERLHSWGVELPFSQYTQLAEAHDTSAEVRTCFGVTELEMDSAEDGTLTLKAGITAQYLLCDQIPITLVEDMYSLNRNVKQTMQQLNLPSLLDVQNQILRAEADSDHLTAQIMDSVFLMDVPHLVMEEDRICSTLSGTFQILGVDDEGRLRCENCRWEEKWSMPASPDADLHIIVQGVDSLQSAGNTMRAEVHLCAMTGTGRPVVVVTGAELGELIEPDPDRPSLILRRIGDESLWELAKQTGSTVEAIQKLNNLQQEPVSDQMLLIPVI